MFRLVEILMVVFKSSAITWLHYQREQRHNIALKFVQQSSLHCAPLYSTEFLQYHYTWGKVQPLAM